MGLGELTPGQAAGALGVGRVGKKYSGAEMSGENSRGHRFFLRRQGGEVEQIAIIHYQCYTLTYHWLDGRFGVKRVDGRAYDELRPIKIIPGYQKFAEGSALIELGKTHVLCSVSVDERVPNFLKGSGGGWLTAEYAMLPRATVTRTQRDSSLGRITGRNQEIQRIIGRSLRAVTDLSALGERTLIVDCDVIQADGGTRTAAITGAYIALHQALRTLANMGVISSIPLKSAVAATSVGIVHSYMMLDLCYDEDCNAAVDFNVVMTSRGEFVEVQGTAEGKPFSRDAINELLSLAEKGIKELFQIQQEVLKIG
jgi:ribonuclease PH